MGACRKRCVQILSVLVVLIAIEIYVIHNQAPYLRQECVLFHKNCPISKIHGKIIDGPNGESTHLKPLKQIMQNWVRQGYSEAAQLSVYIGSTERVNLFARDDTKKPQFNQNSITSIFSSSKNFAALLMAIAVQNKWIDSYDDPVSKYWPEFPSTRLVVPFDEYTIFHDNFCKNAADKSSCSKVHLRKWCEDRNIGSFRRNYMPTISDVLRHEVGYAVNLNQEEILLNTTSQLDMKRMIEGQEYLLHFEESPRTYHSLTRGYILNQIFINCESDGRSMSTYFDEVIGTKMKAGDDEFFLRFDGLENEEERGRMYHINQAPTYWFLYHAMLPIYTGFDRPFTDLFAKQLCPSHVVDDQFCPKESLKGTDHFIKTAGKFPSGNYVDFELSEGPKGLSKHFVTKLGTEMMSASGVGSAHSVAKAGNYMIFGGDVLDKEQVKSTVTGDIDRHDLMFGIETSFSQGGVHRLRIQGLDWYGWGGWGGSLFVFNVEHEAVIAFVPTSFNSPHYTGLRIPRVTAVLNLVTQQLLSESQ